MMEERRPGGEDEVRMRGGEKRVKEVREEAVTTCGIRLPLLLGKILTSDDPFFSRAQPYA